MPSTYFRVIFELCAMSSLNRNHGCNVRNSDLNSLVFLCHTVIILYQISLFLTMPFVQFFGYCVQGTRRFFYLWWLFHAWTWFFFVRPAVVSTMISFLNLFFSYDQLCLSTIISFLNQFFSNVQLCFSTIKLLFMLEDMLEMIQASLLLA